MFSERLAEVIEASGLQKSAIARRIGVTPGTLSGYLAGRIKPDRPVLLLLAQTFNVTVEYLLDSSTGIPENQLADPPVAAEGPSAYTPDAVALTGLDTEDRCTVLRLLAALRSGDAEIRRHLIGQLKIIESAIEARRHQPREERKDVS